MRRLKRVGVRLKAQVECEASEDFSCLKPGRNLNHVAGSSFENYTGDVGYIGRWSLIQISIIRGSAENPPPPAANLSEATGKYLENILSLKRQY